MDLTMFGALEQIADLADESGNERAERLETTADEYNVDPMVLLDAEQATRNLAATLKRERADGLGDFEDMDADPEVMQALRPLMTMLGEDAELTILSKALTKDPVLAANVVHSLHDVFQREGLYDELGTTPRAPAELKESVAVERADAELGEHVEER